MKRQMYHDNDGRYVWLEGDIDFPDGLAFIKDGSVMLTVFTRASTEPVELSEATLTEWRKANTTILNAIGRVQDQDEALDLIEVGQLLLQYKRHLVEQAGLGTEGEGVKYKLLADSRSAIFALLEMIDGDTPVFKDIQRTRIRYARKIINDIGDVIF